MKKAKLDGPQGEQRPADTVLLVTYYHWMGPLCVKTQAWLMIFVFCFLQRNLTHTWPWRCRTLRAQPSLCEAVSHAGSRISCCECCLLSYRLPPFVSPTSLPFFWSYHCRAAGISKLKGHLCCTHFRWLIHTYLSSPLLRFALTALSFKEHL